MKGNNDTRITGCLQRYIVIKKYDLGTSVTKTVTLIVTYVRCHCHQRQTEKNSRTHSVLHQPWWYTDHREYGTGLRTQRTSAQFHHLTMRNNDAWGRKNTLLDWCEMTRCAEWINMDFPLIRNIIKSNELYIHWKRMACNSAGYVESWQNDFKSYKGTAKNRSMILMLKQKSLLKYWILIDF